MAETYKLDIPIQRPALEEFVLSDINIQVESNFISVTIKEKTLGIPQTFSIDGAQAAALIAQMEKADYSGDKDSMGMTIWKTIAALFPDKLPKGQVQGKPASV